MKFILIYYKLEILTCWASDESLPESFTTIVELKKEIRNMFIYMYILIVSINQTLLMTFDKKH